MQVRATTNGKFGSCGCGRSPSGNCNGWHGLTEDQYQAALKEHTTINEVSKLIAEETLDDWESDEDEFLNEKNRGSDNDLV